MSLLAGIAEPVPLLSFLQQPTQDDTTSLLTRVQADLHPRQLDFVTDQSTEIIGLSAGYGAGKTRALAAKAVTLAILNQGFIGAVMEPTGPLIRDIWQNDFDDFLEAYSIPYSFRASPLPEYVLHLPGGDTKILCRSFENWTRIIGLNLAWVLADEIDTVTPSIASKAFPKILGRLRSGNVRQFGAASTPEGFRWMWHTFASDDAKAREDRRLIRMRTADNPHLPPDFIERLQANYDPSLLQAYLNGEFVNLTTGQVYDRFSREHHVTPCSWDPDETILVGIDFNVGNTNAVCAVRRGRELHIFDEVAAAHDTDALGQELRRRYGRARILGYPDASGANRSTNSSRSDIAILESYDISNMAPSANPPVRDRVAAVQALLENGNGERRLFIDPRCRKLIECLELQSYNDKGDPSKDEGYDHMCFAGHTLVATPDGVRRIDSLPSSGWITGPFGTPVRYRNARRTGVSRAVVDVHLSSGDVVRCTPEHQWMTEAGQWIAAQKLTTGTRLTSQSLSLQQSRSLRARLITFAASISSVMVAVCIVLFGSPSMGRSLTGAISIMWMAIAQTITQAISSFSRLASIWPITLLKPHRSASGDGIQASRRLPLLGQPNGMAVMPALNGIDFTTSARPINCINAGVGASHAASAALCLRPSTPEINTAAVPVSLKDDAVQVLTMWSAHVSTVAKPSPSIAMPKHSAAANRALFGSPISVVAVRPAETADVYCLTSDVGSFALASGAVVSNCDACGYLVHRCFEVGRAMAGKAVRNLRLY